MFDGRKIIGVSYDLFLTCKDCGYDVSLTPQQLLLLNQILIPGTGDQIKKCKRCGSANVIVTGLPEDPSPFTPQLSQ